MSPIIDHHFPRLRSTGFSVSSPATIDYNCIAWAAGDIGRCWWPDSNNIGFWPHTAPRAETIEAFVGAFETLGYSLCGSAEHEIGFEKIAIYVDRDQMPTHGARQLDSGLWTSKLGDFEDIEHTLDGLEGPTYGKVAAVMRRAKRD